MKKICNQNFDVAGAETPRIGKTMVIAKLIPLGNFSGGPGIRCLLVLTLLHYFSRPVFWLLVREETLVRRIVQRIKTLLR